VSRGRYVLILLVGCLGCGSGGDEAPGDSAQPEDTSADTSYDSEGQDDSQSVHDSQGEHDSAEDSGDPELECVPESEASVTLCVDRFWDQELDATSQAEVDAAIEGMPAELREQDLQDPMDLARQLQ